MKFVNRSWELSELNKWGHSGRLFAIYGRRRVGKTKLITHWMKTRDGIYTQAIEGSARIQIDQMMTDLQELFKSQLRPQTWAQFFEVLEKSIDRKQIICIDEFPYLVESDPTLPSVLQKWWDHRKNRDLTLILCGSSQKMMHSIFLNHTSPLYGRVDRILKMEPMDYQTFCEACQLKTSEKENFLLYSMVGGWPRYWEYANEATDSIALAELLYFQRGALFEHEPRRILSDEKVEGITPISVLEAIGRGAHRPSEISSRLGIHLSSLSKVFAQLIDVSLIVRQIPFGSLEKDSKKTLYKINDPMLEFWYTVYSGLRSRWHLLSRREQNNYIQHFASRVFEDEVRALHKGYRYWSDKEEFDIVTRTESNKIKIIEVKFAILKNKEREKILKTLSTRVQSSNLAKKFEVENIEIWDWKDYHRQLL